MNRRVACAACDAADEYVASLGCGAPLAAMLQNGEVSSDRIPDEVWRYPEGVIGDGAASLLLLGPSGAGKTTCAAWCAARLFSLDPDRFRKVRTERQWYLGYEIASRIAANAFPELLKIAGRPLLVIDAWTDSLQIGMGGLLAFRLANQLPTIVTSHLQVEPPQSSQLAVSRL